MVPSGAQLQYNWFAFHVACTEAFGSHLIGMRTDDAFTKFTHIPKNLWLNSPHFQCEEQ